MLDEALSCGQMLAELLNDVIDFSKIEAGRLELADEPLDPKGLLEGVVRLLKPQADGQGPPAAARRRPTISAGCAPTRCACARRCSTWSATP